MSVLVALLARGLGLRGRVACLCYRPTIIRGYPSGRTNKYLLTALCQDHHHLGIDQ